MKINISVNDDLVKKVDEFAEKNFLNRSAVFAMGANQLILQQSVPDALGQIALAMKKISESNEIDEESKKKLADFERLSRLLGGAA